MKLGGYNDIKVFGDLSQDIEAADFTLKMSSGSFGLTLLDFSGDACGKKVSKWTIEDQVHLSWFPLKCPMRAADGFAAHLRLFVDPVVPVSIAHTTTTLVVRSKDGAQIGCAEFVTQGSAASDLFV